VMLAALAHGTYNFLCTTLPSGVGFLVPIAAVGLLGQFFARRLWTGLHSPWLATFARGGVPLSRLRFPPAESDEPLLRRLDDDDAAERVAGVREAEAREDQTVYERALALERDPAPEVRAAASKTVEALQRKLRAKGIRA